MVAEVQAVVSEGADSYLGIGLYGVGDAARILHVPASSLRRWAEGYVWHFRGEQWSSPPLFGRDYPELAEQGILTFLDVVELYLIAQYRRAGLSMQAIRAVAEDLSLRLGTTHPFAMQRVHVDGRRFFMDAPPDASNQTRAYYQLTQFQLVMEFAQRFFVKLDYERGLASHYWPLGKDHYVVLDPARSFGKPIVHPEGIPTYALYGPFTAGEPVESIARWFRTSPEAVKAAIEYEMQLAA